MRLNTPETEATPYRIHEGGAWALGDMKVWEFGGVTDSTLYLCDGDRLEVRECREVYSITLHQSALWFARGMEASEAVLSDSTHDPLALAHWLRLVAATMKGKA